MSRKILVAAAWPYVNGSLHLGHVAALLPADIIARYHRQQGDEALFVSGSDCHGTPILNTAEREGISPRDVAERYHNEAVEMLIRRLGFSYSLYSKTMGEFHRAAAQGLFREIHRGGHMTSQEEEHLFCEKCGRFLPDRFVEGVCPNPQCGAAGARGDQCDACGHIYDARELIRPACKICKYTPVLRPSTHLYFQLPAFEERLKAWAAQAKGWRENAVTMTQSMLEHGLQERPVTRDLAWGIPVPVDGFRDKCIYVWFEAVMGYLSCSKEWASLQGAPEAWRAWWEESSTHYYVHGKDNIPFHTIIWPAMLMALGLHLPDRIISSEYLNFGGLKFSKSEGIAIWLPEALSKFDPEAIRFYLTINGPETKDASFQWTDFRNRVNADLIGTLGNFWQRTFALISQHLETIPAVDRPNDPGAALLQKTEETFLKVGQCVERGELRSGLLGVLELAKAGNVYINERAPWKQMTSDRSHAIETLSVCAAVADGLRRLAMPFVPQPVERLNAYLGTNDVTWRYDPQHLGGRPLSKELPRLIKKIETALVEEELAKVERATSQD